MSSEAIFPALSTGDGRLVSLKDGNRDVVFAEGLDKCQAGNATANLGESGGLVGRVGVGVGLDDE